MSVSRCSAETRLFSSTFVSIFETRSTPRSARAGRAVRCGPNMAGWRSGRVWRRTSRRRRWLAGELERTRSWRFAWSDWTRGPSAKETDYDERRRSLGWRECPCWSLDRTAIASVFHCNNAPDSKNAVKITFIFHDTLRSLRLRLRQQGAAGGSRTRRVWLMTRSRQKAAMSPMKEAESWLHAARLPAKMRNTDPNRPYDHKTLN